MSYIPTVEQAHELLERYNKEPFHIQHGETVSKVMGEFAKEYDPENVEFWKAVGMLHDIDFERELSLRIYRAHRMDEQQLRSEALRLCLRPRCFLEPFQTIIRQRM